jgi:hypothetical protein
MPAFGEHVVEVGPRVLPPETGAGPA